MRNALDEAIAARKIPESRRRFWSDQLRRKPKETARTLKALEAGVFIDATPNSKPLTYGEVRSDLSSLSANMNDDLSGARSDGYGRKLVPHPNGGYVVAASGGRAAGDASEDDEGLPWFPETRRERRHVSS